ncbi:hypothetical protein ABZP36_003764 [Zizania latifolia]
MPPPANVMRSASAIVAITESGQHVLKIEGYSVIRDSVTSGNFVRSRPFHVGGENWHIRYFPNGYTSYWSKYISFQVVLDYYVDVRAQFTLSVLDQAGVPRASSVSGYNDFNNNRVVELNYFILRSTLERSEYLKNDCFTVRCDVTVTKPPEMKDVGDTRIVVAVPPSDLTQHLASLLATGEDADVTFEVDGKMFKAHRSVLVARSPVFRALLKEEQIADGGCSGGVVCIDDMEAQDFATLLGYIYTDSLPEMKGGEEVAGLPDLVAAANKYKMERLKLACENKLCEYVNARTVAVMLAFAGEHHCHGLKNRCLQLLDDPGNLKAIVQTEGLEHMTKTYPLVLKDLIAKLAIKL